MSMTPDAEEANEEGCATEYEQDLGQTLRPNITPPSDPRGGFGFNPDFTILSQLDGGFVNANTNQVTPGVRNDGCNP